MQMLEHTNTYFHIFSRVTNTCNAHAMLNTICGWYKLKEQKTFEASFGYPTEFEECSFTESVLLQGCWRWWVGVTLEIVGVTW